MRVACGVEYDGTAFSGWQWQEGARTVQAAVEHALARVADQPVRVHCAGRTDAGVHALNQVFHFDSAAVREEKAWVLGGNSSLPPDVSLRWARPVSEAFHARYSAAARRYRYIIVEGWNRPALWRDRSAWSHCRLDTDRMQTAARHLVGQHDFTSFRAAGCQATQPVREVMELEIGRMDQFVRIDVCANAFLHNMVRIIAGALMSVGRGERTPDWIAEVLAARDRRLSGMTAPASGLYFVGPVYPTEFELPVAEAHMPPVTPG